MRVYKKTKVSVWDIISFFYSRISTRYLNLSVSTKGVSVNLQSYEDLIKEKHLERTVTYLKAKGFHETDVDVWEYKGYFFGRDGKTKFMDACYNKDIALIVDSIMYLTVEVYKEDFTDFRVLCG